MTDLVFRFPEDPQLHALTLSIALAERCLMSLTGTLPVRCARNIDHLAEVRLAKWVDHRQLDNDTLDLVERVIRKDPEAARRLARAMSTAYVLQAWVDPCELDSIDLPDFDDMEAPP